MKSLSLRAAAVVLAGFAFSVAAQAQDRDAGWEVGMDLVYQDSYDLEFDGGTTADIDSDVGLSFSFGYRFSPLLEVQFLLDWQTVDYEALIVTDPPGVTGVRGEYEAFTPRVNLQYNFIDGPLTPFIMGGIGYSFIDTNIPNGRPSTGCWWDPWYGYICTTVQPTKNIDEFVYQIGIGGRWDLSDSVSARLSVENHWPNLGNGSPSVIQAKLGFSYRY